jgi:small subunit ribosomal protein S6
LRWSGVTALTERKRMSFYETVFIARQDLSPTQVDALIDSYKKIIEEHKGKISKTEYWGLKKFAYLIKKNSRGHYVLLNIEAPAEAIHEMERQMRLSEDVVRYLTIKVDNLDKNPSVMMKYVKNNYGAYGPTGPANNIVE